MRYRKKPIVIDAFRWVAGPYQQEDPSWIIDKIKSGEVYFDKKGTPEVTLKINTLEGTMTANQGDYIIKGIKGEIYPCKPNIFEETYEEVL